MFPAYPFITLTIAAHTTRSCPFSTTSQTPCTTIKAQRLAHQNDTDIEPPAKRPRTFAPLEHAPQVTADSPFEQYPNPLTANITTLPSGMDADQHDDDSAEGFSTHPTTGRGPQLAPVSAPRDAQRTKQAAAQYARQMPRPKPANWKDMNKRQRQNWQLKGKGKRAIRPLRSPDF